MSNPLLTHDPTQTPFHPTLQETAALAAFAHGSHTDLTGKPYYLHLARVARRMVRLFPSVSRIEQHAVWLHDIFQGTNITDRDLKTHGYADEVIAIANALTEPAQSPESFAQWISMLASSGDASAIRIKIADLTESADPKRLAILPKAQAASLLKQYGEALRLLQEAINAPELEEAVEDQLVGLTVTLPAMDRWIIEKAALMAGRSTNDFLVEEMTDLAYWITGQGNLKGIPLARTRNEDDRAFVASFTASERKHLPVREWVERQRRKDESS